MGKASENANVPGTRAYASKATCTNKVSTSSFGARDGVCYDTYIVQCLHKDIFTPTACVEGGARPPAQIYQVPTTIRTHVCTWYVYTYTCFLL